MKISTQNLIGNLEDILKDIDGLNINIVPSNPNFWQLRNKVSNLIHHVNYCDKISRK